MDIMHQHSAGDIVRVPFHGDEILTVEVDGKPHIILKPAVEALGVDYWTQAEKLRTRSWATTGQRLVVAADGKNREMLTCDVRSFLMLLATIDERRVAKDVRPKLITYQAEVADAIESYWTTGGALNPRATVPPRDELEMLRVALDQMIATRDETRRTALLAAEADQGAREARARLDAIEGQHDYFAALGWAKLNGVAPTDERTLASLGRVASTVGKSLGVPPGRAPHAHFGEVNTWPSHVWAEAASRLGLVARAT